MYSLSCASLGMPNCDFVAKGETEEEVLEKINDHVNSAHQDKREEISKMNPVEAAAMKETMMSKIVKE